MKIVNVTFQEYNVNILSKLALSTLSFLLKKRNKKTCASKTKKYVCDYEFVKTENSCQKNM